MLWCVNFLLYGPLDSPYHVFLVHTVNYWSSFFPVELCPALNYELQYARLQTRLVRGIYNPSYIFARTWLVYAHCMTIVTRGCDWICPIWWYSPNVAFKIYLKGNKCNSLHLLLWTDKIRWSNMPAYFCAMWRILFIYRCIKMLYVSETLWSVVCYHWMSWGDGQVFTCWFCYVPSNPHRCHLPINAHETSIFLSNISGHVKFTFAMIWCFWVSLKDPRSNFVVFSTLFSLPGQ